jgi:hypothetical protein
VLQAPRMSNAIPRSLLIGITFALGGCLSLRPLTPTVDSPAGVRVVLKTQDDEVFKLEVVNYGQYPIMVNRDQVVLMTPEGARNRVPGGWGTLYTIPPGGHHALNVRFKLGGIHGGDRICINLGSAVTYLNGAPVPVPPLEFVAD